MIELYVLNVPEFAPVVEAGRRVADQSTFVGNYVQLCSDGSLTIERRTARARRAIWFSSIGALRNGKVTQFDSEILHIEPQ